MVATGILGRRPREVDRARPCISGGRDERVSLPLVANQLSSERLAGGARGQASVCSGTERALGSAGSTQAPGTHRGPASTTGGEEIADALVMKATTVSKSSSSQ